MPGVCQAARDILNMIAQQAQSRPYADRKFLRKLFLDACWQIGVL
jgi:hypothetical protein